MITAVKTMMTTTTVMALESDTPVLPLRSDMGYFQPSSPQDFLYWIGDMPVSFLKL